MTRKDINTIIQNLVPNEEYYICINGQEAVNKGYELQNGKCYTGLVVNGKRIAQIEVIIDEQGEYNGRSNKWVNFGYIASSDIPVVLSWLNENGFSGCFAVIGKESETDGRNEQSFIIESDTNLNTETEEEKAMKNEQAVTSSTKETIKGRKGNKMIITGNTNAKTILDNVGKNTFRFIRDTFGIDFQKPVFLYHDYGKFTVKQIWDHINHAGQLPYNKYDYNVAVIVKDGFRNWTIVEILEDGFNIELKPLTYLETYGICNGNRVRLIPETYWRKSDFENARKRNGTMQPYYIIAQCKAYEIDRRIHHTGYGFLQPKIEPNNRYPFIDNRYGHCTIKNIFGKGEVFNKELPHGYKYTDCFDKSGYYTKDIKGELRNKAKQLRNARAKAKFLETDMNGYVEDIKTIVKAAKDYLIELLTKANDYQHIRIVTSILNYYFDSIVFDTELFEKRIDIKWYASVNDCIKAYDYIREKVNDIYRKIEEKTKELEEKNNA